MAGRRPRAERRAAELGTSTVSSTEAQNNFGEVLGRVSREGRVFIRKYGRPEAVVLSIQAYEALVGTEPIDLTALEGKFDELAARMQTVEHRAGVDALFGMSGQELGQAARDAAAGA
jgi:antitoxin Phd